MEKQLPYNDTNTSTGNISFVDSYRPSFESGNYSLSITQNIGITYDDPAENKSDSFSDIKYFTVKGERFSLNLNQVNSIFPPGNSNGEYFNNLPHIIFNKKTLPWERTALPDGGKGISEDNKPTWLALLLIDQFDTGVKETKTGTVNDLASPPAKVFSYQDVKDLEYGQSLTDNCSYIDIPVKLFNEIVPSANDLSWLAHGRSIDTKGKTDRDEKVLELSAVIGNRLPQQASSSNVYLVSLEGMSEFLPDDTGNTKIPDNFDTVRLVYLVSWNFTTKSNKKSFTGILENLDTSPSVPVIEVKPKTNSVENEYITNALALGYIPLNHHTRHGDDTISWYRGPLVPYEVSLKIQTPVSSADSVIHYDPDSGLFDVSYGAAWQLGKLMALQDKGFAQKLYKWKRATKESDIRSFESNLLNAKFSPDTNLLSATGSTNGSDYFATKTKNLLGKLFLDNKKGL